MISTHRTGNHLWLRPKRISVILGGTIIAVSILLSGNQIPFHDLNFLPAHATSVQSTSSYSPLIAASSPSIHDKLPSTFTSTEGIQTVSSPDGSIALVDSQGNEFTLKIDNADYAQPEALDNVNYLKTKQGTIIAVRDYSRFIQPEPFLQIADKIYENAGSDYQFIYEAWYITAHSTRYSSDDIDEEVKSPLKTLIDSEGDCEDLTILIASIITASSNTQEWDMKLVYFDASEPENPSRVNHVALFIDTGEVRTFVEPTATFDGLKVWKNVEGWYFRV